MSASPTTPVASARLVRFAVNAGWNMAIVLINLAAGLLISPYMIRKLGEEGYGIWSLIFSVIGYYALLDFGFRSAVINFTAHAAALKDYSRINVVMSTAIVSSAIVAVVGLVVLLPLAPYTPAWLGISEEFAGMFPTVFVLASTGAILSSAFNIVSGCLEGFQQYSALRKLTAAAVGMRTVLYFLVLQQGGGLIALVVCTWLYWVVMWIGTCFLLRWTFPQLQLRRSLVRRDSLGEMLRYGFHTMVNAVAMLGRQTPPILISRAMPDAAIGYFTLPDRIVQVPVGMIRTVAEMLNPLAAEFMAQDRRGELGRIAILGNRYSFVLYGPIALMLLTWGTPIVELWLGESYAANVAPLMPYFVVATWLALAGQGASPGILFGIRAHSWYAWGSMAEAVVVTLAGILLVDQGLLVLAQWVCGAMVANRCLLLAWTTCRHLGVSWSKYLWSIYGVPVLLSVPLYLLLIQLSAVWPEKNWGLVLMVATLASAVYLIPAFFACLDRQHRAIVYAGLRRVLGS